METPISGFPRGGLRVSDAERDQAVAELSQHYQDGRLTAEEFDDRSGRALQAKTGDELRELFTDLPHPAPPAHQASAVRAVRSVPARLVLVCVIAVLVAGVLGGAPHGNGGNFSSGLLIPVVVLAIIFRHRLFGRR